MIFPRRQTMSGNMLYRSLKQASSTKYLSFMLHPFCFQQHRTHNTTVESRFSVNTMQRLCEGDQDLYSLNKTIEHLRAKHGLWFIIRPNRLGNPDSHGHVWYCFLCETSHKDHRSFKSPNDMWKHLSHCHNHELGKIRPHVRR